jgi:ADP-ribose pyrophosphatase YjhB (NUDIX family)
MEERRKQKEKDNEKNKAHGTASEPGKSWIIEILLRHLSELGKWWKEYKNVIRPRKFGGLAHTVAAINSLILAALVGVAVYPIPFEGASLARVYGLATACFLLGFGAQLIYIAYREMHARERLRKGTCTHAGGVIYKLKDGMAYYLLVRPKSNKDEWVLPKGHIEQGEGHGEAALREVREETGAVVRLICPVASTEFKTEKENVHAKFYLMECLYEGNASETRAREWFPLEKALELLSFAENKHVLQESERKRVGLQTS